MNTAAFWQLIDEINSQSGGDMDAKCARMRESLLAYSDEELASAVREFDRLNTKAYTWPLWGAAYVLNGGCSDDAFSDFRATLISMGESVYEAALADPNTLASVVFDQNDPCYEGFQYVFLEAYQARFGELPRSDAPLPAEPAGDPWDEDTLETLFPALKYLGDAAAAASSAESLGERILRNKNRLYLSVQLLCLAIIFLPLSILGLMRIVNNPEPTTIPLADFNPQSTEKSWLTLPGGTYALGQLRASFFQGKLSRLSLPYVLPGAAEQPALVIAEFSEVYAPEVLARCAAVVKHEGLVPGTDEEKRILLGVKDGALEGGCRPLDVVGKQFTVRPDAVSITVGMGPDSPWLCLAGVAIGLIALVASGGVLASALKTRR